MQWLSSLSILISHRRLDFNMNLKLNNDFPGGSDGKVSAYNAGDLGSIPGLGRSLGEGKGYLLPYSGLENSMDCSVHGVSKSQTQLSDLHFSFSTSVVITFTCQNKILTEYQDRKEKIQRMLKYRIEAFGLLKVCMRTNV